MRSIFVHKLALFGIPLFALLLYLATMPSTIYWGDPGEFTTVVYTLGISHPTGYPLYCLLGKLFMMIPILSEAWRLNFFSALAGAATLGVIFHFLSLSSSRNSTDKTGHCSAFIATAVFGVTQLFWSQAIIAEVHALHVFLLSASLLFAYRCWMEKTVRSGVLFGLCTGLCFANHVQSVFLLFPLWLLLLAGFKKPCFWRRFMIMSACVLPGLLLYLYLPIRAHANPPICWGDPRTLKNFLWVISGGQFKMFLWKGIIGQAHPLLYWQRQIVFYLSQFWEQFRILTLIIPFGVYRLARAKRAFCIALLVGWLLLLFHALNYQVGDFEIYFLPTYLIATAFLAYGLEFLWETLTGKTSESYLRMLKFAICLAPLGFIGLNLNQVSLSGFTAASDYGESAMSQVKPPAIVITHSDFDIYPLWHEKYVRGHGKDVIIAGANFLSSPWYARMLAREGIDTTLPEAIYPDYATWSHAVWQKLVRPSIGKRRIYSTQMIAWSKIRLCWPGGLLPGVTGTPMFIIRLEPAVLCVENLPVLVDPLSVSERYRQFLPKPFLYRFAPILRQPSPEDSLTDIDLGTWSPVEVQG